MNYDKVEKIWQSLLGEYDIGIYTMNNVDLTSEAQLTLPVKGDNIILFVEDEKIYTHLGILGYNVEFIARVPGYNSTFISAAYRYSISLDYLRKIIS